MSMHVLLGGATPAAVRLTNRSVTALASGPSGPLTADAIIEFNSSGQLIVSPGGAVPGEYLVTGASSDYEVRATMASGTNWSGSALSTWLNLGTTRSWNLSASRVVPGATAVAGTATVEIRRVADSAVVATASITLMAEAEVTR